MSAEKAKRRENGDKVHSCLGSDPLTSYLNSAIVKEALHVKSESGVWYDCQNDIDYTVLKEGSQFIYEELKGKIAMLHYSGDKDGVVPTQGTLGWINNLNRTEVAPWRSYKENGTIGEAAKQIAGYFWQLDGLDFGTVHGAGHLCPQDQPARSYQLVVNWMLGNPIDPDWKVVEQKVENDFIQ